MAKVLTKRDLGEVYLEQLSNCPWVDIIDNLATFDREELAMTRDALVRRNEDIAKEQRRLNYVRRKLRLVDYALAAYEIYERKLRAIEHDDDDELTPAEQAWEDAADRADIARQDR